MFEQLNYPIIQAPMAGNIVTPQMVAQICNSGMMGSIPSGYLTYPFPIQHYATARLRKYARENLLAEYMALWVGKHEHLECGSLNELLDKIKVSCLALS